MYLKRALEDQWLLASEQFPVLLLTGPRQSGKTTLLQHLCEEERLYVSLDDPTLRSLAKEDPPLFLERFRPPVLIDEVQYAPELFSYLKMHVDSEQTPGAFWLTGSQQFQMMKGITESLAGRVAIVNLLGFSLREAQERSCDLQPFLPKSEIIEERTRTAASDNLAKIYRNIWNGSMPGLLSGRIKDRSLFYSSYLQTYLQRDVRDLAQVGNQESFLRFVKACAARTGLMLNLSELARDVDITPATAKSWLSILTASFQVSLLHPYHSNVTKRLVKMPKLYFLDTGLCAFLTEWTTPETLSAGAMAGSLLETYVVAEILKSWWHRMQTPHIYYYRDKDGKEIDLLFVQDGTFHPLEIKRSATPRRDWVRHFGTLDRFREGTGEGAVVCLTKSPLPLTARSQAIPVGLL